MSVRVSKKHGLNPSMEVCFWCGEHTGSVIMFGRVKGDEEAPREAVISTIHVRHVKNIGVKELLLLSVRERQSITNLQYKSIRRTSTQQDDGLYLPKKPFQRSSKTKTLWNKFFREAKCS